jgi:hypothetical protein
MTDYVECKEGNKRLLDATRKLATDLFIQTCWIPVEEKLPEKVYEGYQLVLFSDSCDAVYVGYYMEELNRWVSIPGMCFMHQVKFWMPIPRATI